MIEEVNFKTILGKSKESPYWFYSDYNVNIYRGCSHGCIYCDSRSSCYGVDDFDRVRVKANALGILESELMRKRTTGIISTGAMSDPYNPLEKQLELTKGMLKLTNKYGFGILLLTKSNLVLRDINELVEINKHSPVVVIFTVTTFDENLCKKIEPNVSTTKERFDAIKILSAAGITVGVVMMPILPFINDTEENVVNIIRESANSGAKFLYPMFGVTLRDNQKEYYYEKLGKLFPEVLPKYQKYYHKYICNSFNKSLYNIMKTECNKYGLKYKMSDIKKLYKFSENDFLLQFDFT